MLVKELVEEYGFGIWVWCGKECHPAFQVIKELDEHSLLCRYGDDKEFRLNLHYGIDDYEKIDEADKMKGCVDISDFKSTRW